MPERSYPSFGLNLISHVALSADAANFDVQNIPQTFTHLRLVLYSRGSIAAADTDNRLRFNNDSGGNYDSVLTIASNSAFALSGFGAAAATSLPGGYSPGDTAGANRFGITTYDIPHYAGATNFKSMQWLCHWSKGTATADQVQAWCGGTWRSAAAINRITLTPTSGNYKSGSFLTVYGTA